MTPVGDHVTSFDIYNMISGMSVLRVLTPYKFIVICASVTSYHSLLCKYVWFCITTPIAFTMDRLPAMVLESVFPELK